MNPQPGKIQIVRPGSLEDRMPQGLLGGDAISRQTIGSEGLRVFGMVNTVPGFDPQTNFMNGFSDLILELHGPEAGDHARSAVGMARLQHGVPVEIDAEVDTDPVGSR